MPCVNLIAMEPGFPACRALTGSQQKQSCLSYTLQPCLCGTRHVGLSQSQGRRSLRPPGPFQDRWCGGEGCGEGNGQEPVKPVLVEVSWDRRGTVTLGEDGAGTHPKCLHSPGDGAEEDCCPCASPLHCSMRQIH